MCTPAIADLDNDGNWELIVPVSYFFDRAYYDTAEHRRELPAELDLSMYVASGVVVFDLATHSIKWSQHLDLSTDHVDYRCALRRALLVRRALSSLPMRRLLMLDCACTRQTAACAPRVHDCMLTAYRAHVCCVSLLRNGGDVQGVRVLGADRRRHRP